MKIMTIKSTEENTFDVHLEIWTICSAIVQPAFMYTLFVLLGIALHRAYVSLVGR